MSGFDAMNKATAAMSGSVDTAAKSPDVSAAAEDKPYATCDMRTLRKLETAIETLDNKSRGLEHTARLWYAYANDLHKDSNFVRDFVNSGRYVDSLRKGTDFMQQSIAHLGAMRLFIYATGSCAAAMNSREPSFDSTPVPLESVILFLNHL